VARLWGVLPFSKRARRRREAARDFSYGGYWLRHWNGRVHIYRGNAWMAIRPDDESARRFVDSWTPDPEGRPTDKHNLTRHDFSSTRRRGG
jgi:hypothetical protein